MLRWHDGYRAILLVALAAGCVGCGDRSNAADATTSPSASQAAVKQASPSTTASIPEPAVAAWRAYAGKACTQSKLRFTPPRLVPFADFDRTPNGFIPAEFNGDGRPDFVIVAPNEGCTEDGPRDYGSRGGPPTNFVVSTPAGYRVFQGFGGYVEPGMIKRRGNRDVLDLGTNRYFNGSCGPVVQVVWGWTGTEISVIERRDPNGKLVDQEGCPAEPVAASAKPAGGLPIRVGYYAAVEDGCAIALRSPTAGIFVDSKYYRAIDGDYDLHPVRSLGGNRYKLGEAWEQVRVISPNSFIADEGTEYEITYVWCAEREPK